MILETSWEVCNKMGGIYTVLSSRAKVMQEEHKGQVVFVGPLLAAEGEALPQDFDPTCPTLLEGWSASSERQALGLRTVVGQWRVPGSPAVVLVDFSPLWQEKGELYFSMWQHYGLQSDKGYGDYDESCLFSVAAARVMHSILQHIGKPRTKHIAIFNEWQTGMGLLYSKLHQPKLRTLFITHATTVGRSIAGNGKELYAYMEHYNGDQMASELNVEAKHGVEKRAAHASDGFATVSKLTARECAQLLEREAVVLPNGFEGDFVPKGKAYDKARKASRQRLLGVASSLLGRTLESRNTFFVSLSGRYEYRNKGIDLFVESIAHLRQHYAGRKEVIALLLVPGWAAEPRADLSYLLEHPEARSSEPLQHPSLTHWLHNMPEDATQCHLRHLGLDRAQERVNIIQVPVYLHGTDGIMSPLGYYDLLAGMDMTVYPSYYEPWGYTPLESIAFGIPTVTTNLAGFGLWAKDELGQGVTALGAEPVRLVERTDHNTAEVVASISEQIALQASGKMPSSASLRESAFALAEKAEWKHFYKHYTRLYSQL